MVLNVNTDAVVAFTNKLEKLHRSGLPSAVRGALNKAAFDVKIRTMPASAASTFKNRQPNFFKANSRVSPATGFDMNSMKAIVGFTENNLNGSSNYAVKDLEQQEDGGIIKSRSLIPLKQARTGKSEDKVVRPSNRLSALNKLVDSRRQAGKNRRQKFRSAANRAGRGGLVLTEKALFRIDSLGARLKFTPLYSFKKGRSVKVSATGFMKSASMQSGNNIEEYFISEAQRQIEKLK